MAQVLHSTFDNFHSIDDIPVVKRKEYRAYCSSTTCSGTSGVSIKMKWKKNVTRDAVFCPDCNCALFWSPAEKLK